MMWFCGGHGVCTDDSDGEAVLGDSAHVQERRMQWFDRYLRGNRSDVDTGPAFEWIDENATWHSSRAYPLRRTGELTGEGAGTVPLVPGVNPTSGHPGRREPRPRGADQGRHPGGGRRTSSVRRV